ncbi:copper resistance protein [Bradyrhizobium sp. SSBR45G]|uniref:copper resistance CopC family protein n=1 Tax=unclassified Bradyrhizobium TaxID=2631580 RepID=UPI002342B735|nr:MULTISPECIES: copper resistance CopC family protein [unclassified Bradyrhizobium]GLH79008.1 copper resistance protein [Bradyrhizobium sp. SSBR45G]GLH85330.1 copper resistance protein [Bradyrhizobium sp. SSBR45R]
MSSVIRSRHLLSVAVVLLAIPGAASAHAIIVSSQPAAGVTIDKEATAIRLRFNSRIDHARSRLRLRAPDGTEQTLQPATDAPADEIDAQARPLSPGAWHLHWQVLSVDGHITRGDIPFNVR